MPAKPAIMQEPSRAANGCLSSLPFNSRLTMLGRLQRGEVPMKALIRVTLALAAVVVCPFASAEPAKLPPQAAQAHASAGLAHVQKLANLMKQPRAAQGAAGVNAVTTSTAIGPAHCESVPRVSAELSRRSAADTPSGLSTSFQMPLYTRDNVGNPLTPETVTITIWRMSLQQQRQPHAVQHRQRLERGAADAHRPRFSPSTATRRVPDVPVALRRTQGEQRPATSCVPRWSRTRSFPMARSMPRLRRARRMCSRTIRTRARD